MKIALFDFDQTLIQENSLNFLFKHFLGNTPLPIQLIPLLFKKSTYQQGIKLSIKTYLYKKALNGKMREQLFAAGVTLFEKVTPIIEVVEIMKDLNNRGIEIWIVTASPESYIDGIVDRLGWPVKRVIGTTMVEQNGMLTGEIESECQEQEKVVRLNRVFSVNDARYDVVQAFGNLPVDIPMLKMANSSFYVLNEVVKPFNVE
ncbi:MAG: phosphatidylglycerophosphatase C [Psychromonas sp.]|jgi:phosphatidylglycerophosphatase C|uniref:HAD family hydrolase n=1 Tax=Psychromonas sp. TaxID=1884585 RepID=UPI0039E3A364